MKLSCTKENLHQGLGIVSHLTTKNSQLQILQNVLVKADNGIIRLTATNLEIAIHCIVRGKIDVNGETTIPSKLFFDYVSLLPNETIRLESTDEHLDIQCQTHKTKIHGMDASEFPLIPNITPIKTFLIPVKELQEAISQVLFAVASNESRPELTGVCVRFFPKNGEGLLICAATDSYRLSEKTVPTVSLIDQESSIIVPSRTLGEILRILSVFKDDVDLPANCSLGLSDNQIVFSYGPVELVSRLIEGSYPDYYQIIPKQFHTEAVLDREDFVKAVKTASLFSRTGLFDVTLRFHPDQKELFVESTDATRGENRTICPAEMSGVDNTVTVNFRYLLDGLQAMQSDKVVFRMIDASNPCLLTPQDATTAFRYIVMPIKQ